MNFFNFARYGLNGIKIIRFFFVVCTFISVLYFKGHGIYWYKKIHFHNCNSKDKKLFGIRMLFLANFELKILYILQ